MFRFLEQDRKILLAKVTHYREKNQDEEVKNVKWDLDESKLTLRGLSCQIGQRDTLLIYSNGEPSPWL